jgi:hypothetical protein
MAIIRGNGSSYDLNLTNCLIHDQNNSGTGGIYGVWPDNQASASFAMDNCTIVDINNTNVTSGNAVGVLYYDLAAFSLRNNLITDITGDGGTGTCYNPSSVSNATATTNGSDDTSSPNTGLRSLSITYEAAGSDDYQLAAGDTGAINAGTDLGAGNLAVDLNNRNRDTEGDTWDLGAYERVSGSALLLAQYYQQ